MKEFRHHREKRKKPGKFVGRKRREKTDTNAYRITEPKNFMERVALTLAEPICMVHNCEVYRYDRNMTMTSLANSEIAVIRVTKGQQHLGDVTLDWSGTEPTIQVHNTNYSLLDPNCFLQAYEHIKRYFKIKAYWLGEENFLDKLQINRNGKRQTIPPI